jgi:hypothetical protein
LCEFKMVLEIFLHRKFLVFFMIVTSFFNLLLNKKLMPPDCRHAFLVSGVASWEQIVSNPGIFIVRLLHVCQNHEVDF